MPFAIADADQVLSTFSRSAFDRVEAD